MSRRRFVLVFALALLAACANSEQTAQTARYTVTFRMDGAGTGERSAVIGITGRDGRPATVDAVVLAPVMRDMGMASPEVSATADGSGRYVATGAFFPMVGAWEITVRITAGGADEQVTFSVPVQ